MHSAVATTGDTTRNIAVALPMPTGRSLIAMVEQTGKQLHDRVKVSLVAAVREQERWTVAPLVLELET